jgi:glycosyltransferase involved in cell wall biosynthesis
MSEHADSVVSCFLPVFNAAALLPAWWQKNGDELKSVDAKIVIVDNGSTDNTLQEIAKFEYGNIELISHHENLGLESSFLSAKAVINSKYRMFLPADDWLASGYLSSAIELMELNSDVGVVYGKSYIVDLLTNDIAQRKTPYRTEGKHREHPFFPIYFNNSIPDISLFRSAAINTNPDDSDWFLPGGISSLLLHYDTYFSNSNQCFSGKSPSQVSKEWARSGKYYSVICKTVNQCRNFPSNTILEELFLNIFSIHFHTGKNLIEIMNDFVGAHEYTRVAASLNQGNLFALLALFLIDDLLIDPINKTFQKTGKYGSVNDISFFISKCDSNSRLFVKDMLRHRGTSTIFN